jgi:YidC/Oxa1 family membrane protein insertase
MFLVLAFVMAWQHFFMPRPPQEKPAEEQSAPTSPAGPTAIEAPKQAPPITTAKSPAKTLPISFATLYGALQPREPAIEKDIAMETQYLRAVFTSKGAALKALEILPAEGKQYAIKLIDFSGDARERLSLLVNTDQAGNPTAGNIYYVKHEPGSPLVIEFTTEWTEDGNTKTLVKTFDFTRKDGDSPYAFHVALQFKSEKPADKIKFTLMSSATITRADPFVPEVEGHIVAMDKHDKYSVSAVFESEKSVTGAKICLVAVTGKYFATALIPVTFADREGGATLAPALTAAEGGTNDAQRNSILASLTYEAPLDTTCDFIFYAGPRQEEKLAALVKQCPGITQLKASMGWWITGDIAKGILWAMNLIHKAVGNYGVAIIVLTVIVRLAMFPMSKKQQLSMQKMQKLAPRLKAIKDKYKGNRQKINEETVKLYKDYGVNPAAGCLPLLIQIPIFFGLFGALRYAIELRNESFLGYIIDLSLPDGHGHPALQTNFTVPLIGLHVVYFNILPIVMIFVWVLQQALAPKAVDPQQRQQQKMMMIMPIIFGLLLYNYAAGLSIYMICNMFLGMVEQSIVKRIVKKHISDEVPEPVSPARRATSSGRKG